MNKPLYYMLIVMAVLAVLFLKRTYTDLTPAKERFTARAGNLSKIICHIKQEEFVEKIAELKLIDIDSNITVAECENIIKPDHTLKCKFKPIHNSKGKNYYCLITLNKTPIVPDRITANYSLRAVEALPLLLFNATFKKPFPFNQPWLHIGLLLLYFILLIALLRQILLPVNNPAQDNKTRQER